MARVPRAQLIAWGVAAALLVIVAVRFLGGGARAEPSPVRIEGAAQQSGATASSSSSGSAGARAEPGPARGGLYVHVAGAVARPGLYQVLEGSRVAAAVDAAGGPSRRADLAGVNLAAPVQDGQQVVVPVRGGGAGAAAASGSARPGTAAPDSGAPGTAAPPGAKLSLSTATVEQLDGLDGIGPTLAQRIVEYRDVHGGFRSIDELREVEGIGEKRFESLREAVQP